MAFECAVNSANSGTSGTTSLAHNLPAATPTAVITFATQSGAFGNISNRDVEFMVGVSDFTTSMSAWIAERDAQLVMGVELGFSSTTLRLRNNAAVSADQFVGTAGVSGSNIVYTWSTSPASSAPLMQIVFGGCSAKVLTFNADSTKTAGQTQSVTGVGFEPKFLFFIGNPRYSTTGGNTGIGDTRASWGFASIPSSIANRAVSLFTGATGELVTDTGRQYSNTACLAFPNSTNAAIDGSFKVTAVGSDGFTIEIIDQFSADVSIVVLALGGTDFDCEALDWAAPSTDGDQASSWSRIDPIAALLLSSGSAGGYDTYQTDRYRLGFGFVSETGPAEAGFSVGQQDNQASSTCGMTSWQAKTTSLGQNATTAANTLKLAASSPFAGNDIDFTYEGMTFAPIVMACGFAQAVVAGGGQPYRKRLGGVPFAAHQRGVW